MWRLLMTRGVDLTITAIGLTVLMTGPAWAGAGDIVPGPAAGGLAGAAIIGALVVAKWLRRK